MLVRLSGSVTEAPRGVWIGPRVALFVWRQPASAGPFRPAVDGAPLNPPLVAAALPGGDRRVGIAHVPAGSAAASIVSLGDRAPALPLAAFEDDPIALIEGIGEGECQRLLGLLLEAGSGLFPLRGDPAFQALVHALAERVPVTGEPARVVADGPGQLRLVATSGPLPAGALFVVGPRRVVPLAAIGGDSVHALIDRPVPGEVLVGGGEAGWRRRIAATEGATPSLADWLALGGPAQRSVGQLLPAALRLRAHDPAIAALLEAASLLAPSRPRTRASAAAPVTGALELAVADRGGGVFLRGWIRDPHHLVAGFALRASGRSVALAEEEVFRFPRRDVAERFRRAAHAPGEGGQGFVAHVADAPWFGAQPDLAVMLKGGGTLTLTPAMRTLGLAAARDAVLASVRPEAVTEAMLDRCIVPAASRLHAAHLARPRTPIVRRFGEPPRAPEVTVIIPLYRNLSFLRAQVAAFASDPAWAEVETIFVLDSPEQAAEVEHLLAGLVLMHGLPLVLVVPPRNLGYAAANNLGAAEARGRFLLLLNSDVVPDRPGWLAPLVAAATARGGGAAGPKLLFDDGSIQHAGLYFARDAEGAWYNRHYHKGFPRGFAPANAAREVPAVTGAALLVRRALFEKVGGLSEDYIVGDYEDSDLCLRLRAAGARIAYAPAAELWHFERRSIGLHAGYTGTLASTLNRRRHGRLWGEAMAALMARFESGGAA